MTDCSSNARTAPLAPAAARTLAPSSRRIKNREGRRIRTKREFTRGKLPVGLANYLSEIHRYAELHVALSAGA